MQFYLAVAQIFLRVFIDWIGYETLMIVWKPRRNIASSLSSRATTHLLKTRHILCISCYPNFNSSEHGESHLLITHAKSFDLGTDPTERRTFHMSQHFGTRFFPKLNLKKKNICRQQQPIKVSPTCKRV